MTDEQGVQESLLEPYKRTRKGDPETSLAAAESVTKITEKQTAVLDLLRAVGPVTDEQIGEEHRQMMAFGIELPQSDSGLRTRRNELVRRGLVRWTGEHRKLKSGRMGRVWEAPDGQ